MTENRPLRYQALVKLSVPSLIDRACGCAAFMPSLLGQPLGILHLRSIETKSHAATSLTGIVPPFPETPDNPLIPNVDAYDALAGNELSSV